MAVAILISWLGALAFCAFVVAFVIVLIHPRSAISPEDSAEIRKLVTDGRNEKK